MSATGGCGKTRRFLLLSLKTISRVFFRLSGKLLVRAQASIPSISDTCESTLRAGTIRQICTFRCPGLPRSNRHTLKLLASPLPTSKDNVESRKFRTGRRTDVSSGLKGNYSFFWVHWNCSNKDAVRQWRKTILDSYRQRIKWTAKNVYCPPTSPKCVHQCPGLSTEIIFAQQHMAIWQHIAPEQRDMDNDVSLRRPCVAHHWQWLSFMRSRRPCSSAELMKHCHNASVTL